MIDMKRQVCDHKQHKGCDELRQSMKRIIKKTHTNDKKKTF